MRRGLMDYLKENVDYPYYMLATGSRARGALDPVGEARQGQVSSTTARRWRRIETRTAR